MSIYSLVILILMVMSVIVFIFLRNPLMSCLNLLLLAFGFISLLSVYFSLWFSLLLFLVYIGGLLVLMIYICMMSSNSLSLSLPRNSLWVTFMMFFMMLGIMSSFNILALEDSMLWTYMLSFSNSFPIMVFIGVGALLYLLFVGVCQILSFSKQSIKING